MRAACPWGKAGLNCWRQQHKSAERMHASSGARWGECPTARADEHHLSDELQNVVPAAQIVLPTAYLSAATLPAGTGVPSGYASLAVPNRTHSLFINLTQPLLPSGQLRCCCIGRIPSALSTPGVLLWASLQPGAALACSMGCCLHACTCSSCWRAASIAERETLLPCILPLRVAVQWERALAGRSSARQVGVEQRGHLQHAGLPAHFGAAQERPQLHEPHGRRDAAQPGARLRHAAERRRLPGARCLPGRCLS